MSKFVVSESGYYDCQEGPSNTTFCTFVETNPLKLRGAGIDQTGSFEPAYVSGADCITNQECREENKNCVGYDFITQRWTNIGQCASQGILDTTPFCLANGKCSKRTFLQPFSLEENESRLDCSQDADCSPENGKVCLIAVQDKEQNEILQSFPCPSTDHTRNIHNRCLNQKCHFGEKM
jgi:hypothetical protein